MFIIKIYFYKKKINNYDIYFIKLVLLTKLVGLR